MRISAFLENIDTAAKENRLSLAQLLAELRDRGLESVYCGYSGFMKTMEAERIDLMQNLGLCLEGLWENIPMNLISEKEAFEASKALIDCAERNGAEHVLIIPCIFPDRNNENRVTLFDVKTREAEIVRSIQGMRKACGYGAARGVTVTMEDYDVFTSPIVYPQVLRRFFEEIPELKCSFDTGNFVPCDGDVLSELRYYRDRIAVLHLKDRVENDDQNGRETMPYLTCEGRKYYPAAAGFGGMHISEVLSEMKKTGYQGAGIIELFGSADMYNKLTASIDWMKENARY